MVHTWLPLFSRVAIEETFARHAGKIGVVNENAKPTSSKRVVSVWCARDSHIAFA